MKIAITGANGCVGKILIDNLLDNGHEVIAGVRDKLENRKNLTYRKYNLNFSKEECQEFLKDADAVIHLAFQKKELNLDSIKINLEGTKNLFKAANSLKYKIHFSTMSAHKDAISEYGISKFKIEQELKNIHILKCGLVLSSKDGLFQNLKKIISKSPIIPAIGSGKQRIHTLYYQDLNLCINKILKNEIPTSNYLCAEKKSITMKELYIKIAKSLNKKIILIPIPYFIAEIGFKIISLLPVNISEENLKGLKSLKSFNGDIFFPNINFKDINQSLTELE